MNQQKAYKYRMYPTEEQKQILARTFGCCRYVYNWALRERTDAYYKHGPRLGYHETSAALTVLKQQPDTSWLGAVASVPLQQSLRHLDKAFRNFFEGRAKYPAFKKKHGEQSATYVGTAFKWDGTSLILAKMDEPLHIVWSRPLPEGAKPTTITVTKDKAERYFISILVEEEIKHLPVINKQVGLDLGFSDVGWGEFVRQLEYKAEWYGRTVLKIEKFYPSSKCCFRCGHILESLSLEVRVWTCPACQSVHDRDVNAARNVLAAGLAVAACGESVRPGAVKAKPGTTLRSRKPIS